VSPVPRDDPASLVGKEGEELQELQDRLDSLERLDQLEDTAHAAWRALEEQLVCSAAISVCYDITSSQTYKLPWFDIEMLYLGTRLTTVLVSQNRYSIASFSAALPAGSQAHGILSTQQSVFRFISATRKFYFLKENFIL